MRNQPATRLLLGDRTNGPRLPPLAEATIANTLVVMVAPSLNNADGNANHVFSSTVETISSRILCLDQHDMNEDDRFIDSNGDSLLGNSLSIANTNQQAIRSTLFLSDRTVFQPCSIYSQVLPLLPTTATNDLDSTSLDDDIDSRNRHVSKVLSIR